MKPRPAGERSEDGTAPPPAEEDRVQLTPTLIVLGILALAVGLLAGLVMSAKTFVD